MTTLYDSIGHNYGRTRSADPRIAGRIFELLELPTGSRILDVGAGIGNYSLAMAQRGLGVTALEPSSVMRAQRKEHPQLQWTEGSAETLPFSDQSFAGAILTLSLHHFADWLLALRELLRVVGDGPIVILIYTPDSGGKFWLHDYFPRLFSKDREKFPTKAEMEAFLSLEDRQLAAERFFLPPDLQDNFGAAAWATPERYLDEGYRSGISTFSYLGQEELDQGLKQLSADLESGKWDARHGKLREQEYLDVGYVFWKIGV